MSQQMVKAWNVALHTPNILSILGISDMTITENVSYFGEKKCRSLGVGQCPFLMIASDVKRPKWIITIQCTAQNHCYLKPTNGIIYFNGTIEDSLPTINEIVC